MITSFYAYCSYTSLVVWQRDLLLQFELHERALQSRYFFRDEELPRMYRERRNEKFA